MNKQLFLQLLRNPGKISEEELRDLEKFAEQYPYSQAAHILIAKYYAEHGHMLAGLKVKKAALYTADRSNLKHLIENSETENAEALKKTASFVPETIEEPVLPTIEVKEVVEPIQKKVKEVHESLSSETIIDKKDPVTEDKAEADKEALLEELRQSLISLRESRKKAFIQKEKPESVEEKNLLNSEYSTPVLEAPSQELIGKKDEPLEQEQTNELPVVKEIEVQKNKAISADSLNHYIPDRSRGPVPMPEAWEYKSLTEEESQLFSHYFDFLNQKRLVFKKNKKKEEEIINRLSQEEPVMPKMNAKTLPEETEDLSTKSTTLQKGPISENFARILVLQGKTEKAIEIYSELCLKIPEKKAYFEAQIEKLKTKL